jgi:excisionase family DNA binding protein
MESGSVPPAGAATECATLSVVQAASLAGVGVSAIRSAIRARQVPFVRFGGGKRVRIPTKAFHAWLDSHTGATGACGCLGGVSD